LVPLFGKLNLFTQPLQLRWREFQRLLYVVLHHRHMKLDNLSGGLHAILDGLPRGPGRDVLPPPGEYSISVAQTRIHCNVYDTPGNVRFPIHDVASRHAKHRTVRKVGEVGKCDLLRNRIRGKYTRVCHFICQNAHHQQDTSASKGLVHKRPAWSQAPQSVHRRQLRRGSNLAI
jgi:hypothetical protein